MNYLTYDFVTINIKEDNDPHEQYTGPYTTLAQFGNKNRQDFTVAGATVLKCVKDLNGKS